MGLQNEEITAARMATMMKKKLRTTTRVSFSAKVPEDVSEAFQENCICTVKYSMNPFSEIKESILQMVENLGIRDWNQMEDLIYCYIALNSAEIHSFIEDAFLSLRFRFLDPRLG